MEEKKVTNEELAGMIAKGFASTATKHDIDSIITEIEILQTGQEDIKLRLDNAAWRFELVALQERVEVLEGKLGIETKKR